jgi:glutathionyl-hydroquinone reductase
MTDDGAFHRPDSAFRQLLEAGGTPEPGRYHLYVCRACPWAHRTLIGRRLMGLERAISVSYVDPIRDERGWAFTGGLYEDPVNGFSFLSEAYEATDSGYEGRVSVPVLWDRQEGHIANNESSEILRMLETDFRPLADHPVDLYPEALAADIDALNERIYDPLNNGVYRAGFARSQSAYEAAVDDVFDTLDELEGRLGAARFLFAGGRPVESDIRLFTTLIRFDAVYAVHFKCSRQKIVEYPNLWGWLADMYRWPGVAETVSLSEIRRHYYGTHPEINPRRCGSGCPRARGWGSGRVRGKLLHVVQSLGEFPCLIEGEGPPLVYLAGLLPKTGVESLRRLHEASIAPYRARRSVHYLNRRRDMPAGMSMSQLAAEHAEAMRSGFDRPVDVIGMSTGGSIAQQLAAEHPDVVRRLVLISTACRLSDRTRADMRRVAARVRKGARRRAVACAATSLVAEGGWGLPAAVAGSLLSPLLFSDTDLADLATTIEAEDTFDLAECPKVAAETLLVAGGRDRFYSRELFEETARLIPRCELEIHPGHGHDTVTGLTAVHRSVLNFLG